ncbi:MAG: rRNA maturation RNase YbeY [Alphaproteobacteria bacterium]
MTATRPRARPAAPRPQQAQGAASPPVAAPVATPVATKTAAPLAAKVAVLRQAGDWRRLLPGAVGLARRAARAAVTAGLAELAAKRSAARPVGPAAGEARPDSAGPAGLEMSVVLGDDGLLQSLNRQWRGHDRPTNVLAFAAAAMPSAGHHAAAEHRQALGEVIVSGEAIEREARTQGKSPADHFTHLVVHGTLHLLDYDHERPSDACRMESLERRILATLDVTDPYDA